MKLIVLLASCLFAWGTANADEAAQCQVGGGTYLTGHVTAGPVFARGRHPRRGIELSHTHLTLLSDRDRRSWDVAVDDVFASGYDAAGETVPAPLSKIRVGDRLEVCGRPFTDDTGPGIDWVHTNCGVTPTSRKPNGWLKVLAANGIPGPNLESSQEYCHIWR
ncbi:MAG TPA: hypothetical protein VHX61_15450 [Rhizomicrobium sp.]|jgi:hypothetical protein|nr:hypothetical protein [Rhizomicrobium sp.]